MQLKALGQPTKGKNLVIYQRLGVHLFSRRNHLDVMGMGVQFGWLDHIFLAIACSSVIAYFFAEPSLSEGG